MHCSFFHLAVRIRGVGPVIPAGWCGGVWMQISQFCNFTLSGLDAVRRLSVDLKALLAGFSCTVARPDFLTLKEEIKKFARPHRDIFSFIRVIFFFQELIHIIIGGTYFIPKQNVLYVHPL